MERGRLTGKAAQEPLGGECRPTVTRPGGHSGGRSGGEILSGTVKMTQWSQERRPQQLALCRVIYTLFPE